MADELNASRSYQCANDRLDEGQLSSSYTPVGFADEMLKIALKAAALFELDDGLSWVPRRVKPAECTLMVLNNNYVPKPVLIKSLVGPIASITITELPLDSFEQSLPIGQGWLPFGFDNASVRAALGENNATHIAGLDVRCFSAKHFSDSTSAIVPPAPPQPPRRRPLCASLRRWGRFGRRY
jgi:hypothetical protein